MADLDDLASALEAAPAEAQKQVRQVVAKGALNVKNDWRKAWTGLDNAPALPKAITYDVKSTRTGASAEIGPDVAKRQGYLGNLLAFGSVNNQPKPGMQEAADAEEPRLAKAVEDLGVKVVEG